MSAVTAYTALEILLLCQSLARLGTDPASFSRISDALKSNALVREAKAFDIGRLSPDALRELYLNLLKDEESTDGGANGTPGGAGPNGQAGPQDPTSSAGSRKRKIPSPLPGGTQDASSLSHLVDRLYNRYKDYIIRSIREDETRYKHLRRDIQEIEHGHWDDRLSKQAVMLERDPKVQPANRPAANESFAADSSSVPAPGNRATQDGIPLKKQSALPGPAQLSRGGDAIVSSHARPDADADGQKEQSVVAPQPGKATVQTISRIPTGTPTPTEARSIYFQSGPVSTSARSTQPSDAPKVATPGNVSEDPLHHGTAALTGQGAKPTGEATFHRGKAHQVVPKPDTIASSDAKPRQVAPSTPQATPTPMRTATPIGPLPGGASSSKQRAPLPLIPTTNVSPAAAEAAAPPTTIQRSPPHLTPSHGGPGRLPVSSVAAPSTIAGPQYKSPVVTPVPPLRHPLQAGDRGQDRPPSQVQESSPTGKAPQLYAPQTPAEVLQTASQPPSKEVPSAGTQEVPRAPPAIQGSFHPQRAAIPSPRSQTPFKTPDPTKQPAQQQSPQKQFSLSSHLRSDLAAGSQPPTVYASPYQQRPASSQALPHTPMASTPQQARRPPPVDTSASSTRWKQPRNEGSSQTPGSPLRPPPSPLSDTGSPSRVGSRKQTGRRATSSFPKRQRESSADTATQVDESAREASEVRRTSRARTSGTARSEAKRPRTDSATSSATHASARARIRSQSIPPQTDEVRAITRVKHEQPSTPVGTLADAENEMGGETTADESVQAGSRRGGGVEKPEERHATGKRKRDRAETPDTMDVISPGHDSAASHTGPRYIMSTPNFPRTTAPVLNDISGHKYASLFAAPVKEKDAPGYRDLIYQPQDLKSIKTAIAAGGRAVVAAGGVAGTPTEGVESPGPGVSTPGKNSSILVTRGPDVVPPKGIVNSAQFEREVMRMFANAVMFNHDPDRGFGPAFRERSENAEDGDEGTSAADAEEEAAGRVVQDTRKMFEAVEKTVTDWRAAERSLKHLPV